MGSTLRKFSLKKKKKLNRLHIKYLLVYLIFVIIKKIIIAHISFYFCALHT